MANARVLAKGNGALARSPTALGALAMESFALPSFAILIKTRVKVRAEACGVPTAATEVVVEVLAQVAQLQRQCQQLQLPSLQALEQPQPQDTGIALVVLVDVPTFPLVLERTASLLTVTPTPCLTLRLVMPMVRPFMGLPPSLKNSLVMVLRGWDRAVERATS